MDTNNAQESKMLKATKQAPGCYTVMVNGQEWNIFKNQELVGDAKWVAYNTSDKYDVLDPCFTKREVLEVLSKIDANEIK